MRFLIFFVFIFYINPSYSATDDWTSYGKGSGGKKAGELSMGARIAIGKKLDKKKSAIAKLSKKLFPKIKKGEVERLKRFRAKQSEN